MLRMVLLSRLGRARLLAVLAFSRLLLAQPVVRDVRAYLPSLASVEQQIALHMENNGTNEVAVIYRIPEPAGSPYHTAGLCILRYRAASVWTNVFDEQTPKMGVNDELKLERVQGPKGQEALLVIKSYSGAGTATFWEVVASIAGKICTLDPSPAKAKVLKERGYQDWGYNRVVANGADVTETQPGYSNQTARCCPDRPSLEMRFQFTGSRIVLQAVKELPFTRPE